MGKLHAYIADADAVFTASVCAALRSHRGIAVVGTGGDGRQALRDITRLRPDLLLTDVQLPGMDGITLLRETHLMNKPPVGIVCTRFYSDISVEHAYHSGAAYFLYKPVDFGVLPRILEDCHRSARRRPNRVQPMESEEDTSRRHVERLRRILLELGIPTRLLGGLYLIESVLILKKNGALLKNLSKGLYAEVAAQLATSPACVERSLRNAIEIAYTRGSLNRGFPRRPTNKQFIEYILDRLDASEDMSDLAAEPILEFGDV